MTSSRQEKLFELALEQPAEKRSAFLDAACGADDALRQGVESLLAAHDRSSQAPAPTERTSDAPPERSHAEGPGKVIDRYKLLEKIGEGGFGVVYVAEQKHPVKRRVALKIIKLGMDTKQVVARFEAERQALALMDHPNIARVLDAGATETGRPYFVMELVRGIPITEYCDQQKLGTKKRLDLFMAVCHAIQHAHQKGIIHRDVKPSNIMVTLHDGVPIPKVIDFGIAKAIQHDLTDKTVYTRLQQFVGTPVYMSPEQAEMSGLDVDTRSDIYSLGVLLYELLTGRTPFDHEELMKRGVDAMRQAIRETEPPKPSTRVRTMAEADRSTTAARHAVDVPRLISLLKGDLDWIVMKCLEKDRTRRYETANGLAMDIERHLNNEPVVARPPSTAYRLQKAWRRNKVVYTAVAAVGICLLLALVVSSWSLVREHKARVNEASQRQLAEDNAQKAIAAQAREEDLRKQAQTQELVARRRAYASDMNVARQALAAGNLGRALDLLNRQRPQPGQEDLRGWEWRYLWQQTRSDALSSLGQIDGEVGSLAVSPDGHWLAVGALHKSGLTLWDLRTRQEVIRLNENEYQIKAAFSPMGPLLAFTGVSGEGRSVLHLWNTATRQMEDEFSLEAQCAGLAFSRDGRMLATSCFGGPIVLWKIPEGAKLATFTSDLSGLPINIDFVATLDLSLAAYVLGLSQIRVVDLHNGTELWKATASKQYVTALAFSPDGKTLASAAGFGESDIKLWDVATGKEIGRLEGHGSWVSSIVFWPDGKKLASASADQTIRTWDLGTRQCLDVMRGHRDEVWRLALLPDNQTLVSGSKDGAVCLWDTSRLHPRQERITLQDRIGLWHFTPNGALLTVGGQRRVARWSGVDFQNKESLTREGTLPESVNVYSGCFSSDGRLLAAALSDATVRIWDVSTGRLVGQFTQEGGRMAFCGFFAGGNRLLTWTANDSMFHVWDLAAKPVAELQSWRAPSAFGSAGHSVAMSPDNRLGVALGDQGDTVIRDLDSQKSTYPELGYLEAAGCVFSHDGKRFAMASHLGYARVWNTATWQAEATLRGFQLGTHSVAFSPYDQRLATGAGSSDDALKLWDVASWQQVLSLPAKGSIFVSTAFSSDGNTLAAMSSLGVLNIWSAPSWDEINAAEAQDKMEVIQP